MLQAENADIVRAIVDRDHRDVMMDKCLSALQERMAAVRSFEALGLGSVFVCVYLCVYLCVCVCVCVYVCVCLCVCLLCLIPHLSHFVNTFRSSLDLNRRQQLKHPLLFHNLLELIPQSMSLLSRFASVLWRARFIWHIWNRIYIYIYLFYFIFVPQKEPHWSTPRPHWQAKSWFWRFLGCCLTRFSKAFFFKVKR